MARWTTLLLPIGFLAFSVSALTTLMQDFPHDAPLSETRNGNRLRRESMGIEFGAEFERDIGASADIFPTYLFRFAKFFDPIIASEGLPPFGAFLSPDGNEWFDPTDGLRPIRGCLEYLRQYPGSVRQSRLWVSDTDVRPFIKALEDIERALVVAESEGVRFHYHSTSVFEICPMFVVQIGDKGYEYPTEPPDHEEDYGPD